jgi:glucose/mannose transport system permease protein
MIPVVIAAAWQLSGFAMAMYLAGLGTIPQELKEAAQLDGATTWQVYRHIIIPLLTPITVSIVIILGHVSLKIFDLIFAMSGKGPGFATDVPGIFIFDKTFGAQQYNIGAAASVVMLLLVSIVIVPYLARTLKEL